jgi:hypothetical protein
MLVMPDHIRAHQHSIRHREELLASEICGCFYCEGIFVPEKIVTWIDEGGTALCPICNIDSVIGSASGFPVTPAFLAAMHRHWF